MPSKLNGALMGRGSDHLFGASRSAYHRWLLLLVEVSVNGRLETNRTRMPSGLKKGSQSFHLPENGNTTGWRHFPLRIVDEQIVRYLVPWQKYAVFPSGEKDTAASMKGVDTIPGANTSDGIFFFIDWAIPRSEAVTKTKKSKNVLVLYCNFLIADKF